MSSSYFWMEDWYGDEHLIRRLIYVILTIHIMMVERVKGYFNRITRSTITHRHHDSVFQQLTSCESTFWTAHQTSIQQHGLMTCKFNISSEVSHYLCPYKLLFINIQRVSEDGPEDQTSDRNVSSLDSCIEFIEPIFQSSYTTSGQHNNLYPSITTNRQKFCIRSIDINFLS